MLLLHSFWPSIAAYRVRIAHDRKGIAFEERAHDLTQGVHNQPAFRQLNPAGAVPALEGATHRPITQSLDRLEWLEETDPTPALLLSHGGAVWRGHGGISAHRRSGREPDGAAPVCRGASNASARGAGCVA